MPYQSLYRRYRPQRFEEVRGQDHVVKTLRNAVRTATVAHAYLFSGPRGTGKTSTARILAKALNCAAPEDGEPCGRCQSCVEITEGRSFDVIELDAASNRGIDAMRELVARVALGTPGRWKVYIVDEVHMLTTEAANTLLKTLEEPPSHVVFVLATTEPQKVLLTIRSRTQPFEFRLLPAGLLVEHLRWVASDAGLDVAPEAIDLVARRGNGSARDALSVLDQVAAAGGIDQEPPGTDEVIEALSERDAGQALVFVAERAAAGHDARQLTRDILEHLRQVFLATMSRGLVGLPDDDLARVEAQGRRLGPAATVRAMETLGDTLVDMRDAPDPRVLLEVALVRLCNPDVDVSPAALLERVERLERALAERDGRASPPPPPAPPSVFPPAAQTTATAPGSAGPPAPARASGAADARQALGATRPDRSEAAPSRAAAPSPPAPSSAAPPPTPTPAATTPVSAAAAPPPPGPPGPPPAPSPPPAGARAPSTPPPAAGARAPDAPPPAAGARAPGAPGLPGAPGPPAHSGPPPTVASPTAPHGPPPGPTADPTSAPAAAGGDERPFPGRDDLTLAWGDRILDQLSRRAKVRFQVGRFVSTEGGAAVFALPNAVHRDRCEEARAEVEQALSAHFGRRIPLRLVVDQQPTRRSAADTAPAPEAPEEDVDLGDLRDAPPGALASPLDHVMEAFKGAQVVEE